MATKKTVKSTEKKISSNSKEAKNIIRSEIRSYYSPAVVGGGRSSLSNMAHDAEAAKNNLTRYEKTSDYKKGVNLAERGGFAVAYDDKRQMLGKIYGKKSVTGWNNAKVDDTYNHLIGREYDSMCREQKRKAATAASARKTTKKAATSASKTTKKRK